MAKPLSMTSMELDDEDILDMPMPVAFGEDKPKYPYGLKLCLTHAEFRKLGLDYKDAFVGGTLHGHFMGRVTSVSCNETDSGECCRIEVQVEDLAIESEDEENAEME